LFFILFTNPADAIVALHLFHFLISAINLTALFKFSKPIIGSVYAGGITLVVAVFPLYVVQTGYMYAEILLALTSILTLKALANYNFKLQCSGGFLASVLSQ